MRVEAPFILQGRHFVQACDNTLNHALIFKGDILEYEPGQTPRDGTIILYRRAKRFLLGIFQGKLLQDDNGRLRVPLTPDIKVIGILTGFRRTSRYLLKWRPEGYCESENARPSLNQLGSVPLPPKKKQAQKPRL